MKLSPMQQLVMDHAKNTTTDDGWFPEFDFNGRVSSSLKSLVKAGLLKSCTRTPPGRPPPTWYRLA